MHVNVWEKNHVVSTCIENETENTLTLKTVAHFSFKMTEYTVNRNNIYDFLAKVCFMFSSSSSFQRSNENDLPDNMLFHVFIQKKKAHY